MPIAIKDNRAVAGMPLTMGSDLFDGVVSERDAYFVRRLRDAGFVIVGKTAMPEMGILPTTESRRFGPTANPWALDRTPGGSSGGAAAAVAAGMVPIAHGNDGGGSIRIPAACCGLVGLKPARGRVSVGPDAGQSFLACDGVLTRTVADTAAVLDVLAGYEPGDATWAPPPPGPYPSWPRRDARPAARRRWRSTRRWTAPRSIPSARRRPATRPRCWRRSAITSRRSSPPWSGLDLLPDFTRAFGPLISMTHAVRRPAGRPRAAERRRRAADLGDVGARPRAGRAHLLTAQDEARAVARSVVSFCAGYDAVLTPALGRRPVPTGEIHGRGPDPWDHYRRSGAFTPYTAIVNVTGQPAISLPLYHGEDGLPTAVQLIGAARARGPAAGAGRGSSSRRCRGRRGVRPRRVTACLECTTSPGARLRRQASN